ncbi:MAG: hypothetical protein CMJ24_04375 [Phycisphaerae bacterium]|nr:hypothetical protein [Phycisphaerae bacterium]
MRMTTSFVFRLLIVAGLLASAALAEPEDDGFLAELGGSLKAAVLSGSMTREDAGLIWKTASQVQELQDKFDALLKDDQIAVTGDDSKSQTLRLIPPDPERPRLLLQPEFLGRDSQFLIDRLALDPQRAEIVDLMLRDYEGSYDILTVPLVDAMQRYQRAEVGGNLAITIERLDRQLAEQDIDMEVAMSTMQDRLQEYAREAVAKRGGESAQLDEKSRALSEEWVRELEGGLDSLDENMSRLRDRLVLAMDGITEAGGDVTEDDLLRLAIQLRRQRDSIRNDVLVALRMTIVEEGDELRLAELESALGHLEIKRGLVLARLGGERIDPWQAIDDGGEPPAELADRMSQMEPVLAERARGRLQSAIDRELSGLRLLVDSQRLIDEFGGRDDVPEDRWGQVLGPFSDAWHRQIDASAVYRDSVLELVDESTMLMLDHDVDAAFSYRDRALRQGFPDEMRIRWYERAVAAASGFDDLSEDLVEAIDRLSDQVAATAREIRDRAIEGRIERDLELARKPVLRLWGIEKDEEQVFEDEDWKGREFEAHERLADQVEDALRVLLTIEQFDALPPRQWRRGGGKGQSPKQGARKRGRGKSGGKGGGKGRD